MAGTVRSGSLLNQFGFPYGGITMDKTGNIYVADKLNNRVMKWAPGGIVSVVASNDCGSSWRKEKDVKNKTK